MSDPPGTGAIYGNLSSYKHCTRPAAHRLYGGYAGPRTIHQQSMHDILHALFVNGACTTWEAAKITLRSKGMTQVRAKEKEYRRLFAGRHDARRHTGGMLDTGLVVREGDEGHSRYRLSIHGMLYCMDVMSPSGGEMDRVAAAYAGIVPRVFGRMDTLKGALGDSAYTPLKVLAKGILLDGQGGGDSAPLHEIMLFLGARYHRWYESISESELAEQLSYWYYTFLLCRTPEGARDAGDRRRSVLDAMRSDGELSEWYGKFLAEAVSHYKGGLRAVSGSLDALRGTSSGVALDRVPQVLQGDGLA